MELIKFVEKKIGIKFNEMKEYKIFNKKGRNDFERFLITKPPMIFGQKRVF